MKETNKIFDSHPTGKARPLAVFDFSCDTEDLIFTQEDVKKAENEGYSKGFEEGLEIKPWGRIKGCPVKMSVGKT